MHTNRLDNIAERQRVNNLRDLVFVILVAAILVFQLVSLSQARAFSQHLWLGEDTVETIHVARPAPCVDAQPGLQRGLHSEVAGLPGGAPLC